MAGLNELHAMKNAHTGDGQWLPTGRAVEALGISRTTLHRWCGKGYLEETKHFREGITPNSPRRWNCSAVEERIKQIRKKPKRPNNKTKGGGKQ